VAIKWYQALIFNAARDYEEKPELDHYDPELLDDTQYVPMSLAERIRAERDLEHRDELEGRNSRNSRLPAALFSDSDSKSYQIISLKRVLITLC
jgi:hypothetical protein